MALLFWIYQCSIFKSSKLAAFGSKYFPYVKLHKDKKQFSKSRFAGILKFNKLYKSGIFLRTCISANLLKSSKLSNFINFMTKSLHCDN